MRAICKSKTLEIDILKLNSLSFKGKTQCWIELEPWQWKVYMTLVAITVFLIPAIIITACYTIIVYTIWTKSKVLSPVKQLDNNKRE